MARPGMIGAALAEGPETDRIRALLDEAEAAARSAAARSAPAARSVPAAPRRTGRPGRADGEAARVTIPAGDDAAALVLPAGQQLVASSDASVEGIHFRRAWMTWETIGYRAAAAALSDLAAMAASPIGLLLSAALPPEVGASTAAALGRGVGAVAGRVGCALLGGDLTASPGPVFLDVTALGSTPAPVSRGGARPGDEVWVTGRLGGAACALRDFEAGLEPDPTARAAFERPRPRIVEARWLAAEIGPRAMIDLSDGLLRDAAHLAAASGARIDIATRQVPASPALDGFRDSPAGLSLSLAGGEDYELLFAVSPGALAERRSEFEAAFSLELTRIGAAGRGSGVALDGRPAGPGGFDHFAPSGGAA